VSYHIVICGSSNGFSNFQDQQIFHRISGTSGFDARYENVISKDNPF
jgi:hypothetical protein